MSTVGTPSAGTWILEDDILRSDSVLLPRASAPLAQATSCRGAVRFSPVRGDGRRRDGSAARTGCRGTTLCAMMACAFFLAGCYRSHSISEDSDASVPHDTGNAAAALCLPGETIAPGYCPRSDDPLRPYRPFNGEDYVTDRGDVVDYCFCARNCGLGDCAPYPGTTVPMECRIAVEPHTGWGLCFRPCDVDDDCPVGSVCAPLGMQLARPWQIARACAFAASAMHD